MTFPANYAVIAEDELTYVTGGNIWDAFPAVMTSENWRTFGTNMIKIVGNTFLGSFISTVLGTAFGTNYVFGGIADTIGNVVSTAFSWGRDLIEGIGNGIASAANWLFSGVKSIAQGIASFLHFSRPDKGPLREYEQWMPDMMAGMAKGIRLNSGLLEGAAQDAAARMRSALTVPADLAAAAVGTAPAQHSAGRSLTITVGDVIVNGSSAQDVDGLADLIVQKITRQVRRKEAAYGLV